MMAVRDHESRARSPIRGARERSGSRCDLEAGMAKLLAARIAWANADNALRSTAGNGFALEYPVRPRAVRRAHPQHLRGRRGDPAKSSPAACSRAETRSRFAYPSDARFCARRPGTLLGRDCTASGKVPGSRFAWLECKQGNAVSSALPAFPATRGEGTVACRTCVARFLSPRLRQPLAPPPFSYREGNETRDEERGAP